MDFNVFYLQILCKKHFFEKTSLLAPSVFRQVKQSQSSTTITQVKRIIKIWYNVQFTLKITVKNGTIFDFYKYHFQHFKKVNTVF